METYEIVLQKQNGTDIAAFNQTRTLIVKTLGEMGIPLRGAGTQFTVMKPLDTQTAAHMIVAIVGTAGVHEVKRSQQDKKIITVII